jgi:hypothetical protein
LPDPTIGFVGVTQSFDPFGSKWNADLDEVLLDLDHRRVWQQELTPTTLNLSMLCFFITLIFKAARVFGPLLKRNVRGRFGARKNPC